MREGKPPDAVSGPEREPVVAFDSGVGSFEHGPGTVHSLRCVSFDIRDNVFLTLLGPSGCGKTTLLRAPAALEHVTRGVVRLLSRDILKVPAFKRPMDTVIGHSSQFLPLTVAHIVACGLGRLRLNRTGGHQFNRHREAMFDQAAALGARVGRCDP